MRDEDEVLWLEGCDRRRLHRMGEGRGRTASEQGPLASHGEILALPPLGP